MILRCRCMGCGEYFSTTRNFDRHRVGKHPERVCANPCDVGLVRSPKGFWQRPASGRILRRANSRSGDRTPTQCEAST